MTNSSILIIQFGDYNYYYPQSTATEKVILFSAMPVYVFACMSTEFTEFFNDSS